MVQSQAEKDAKGNPGRHKSKKRMVTDTAPSRNGAPKELSKAGLEVWNVLTPDLRKLSFLRDTDTHAFARYCEHAAKWWALTQKLAKLGGETYITDSNHGKMERLRPEFLVRDRIEKHLVTLEDRFGMNPACRQQILLRMANQLPLLPEKPNGTNQPDDDPSSAAQPELPSAIGFMRSGTTSVN